MWLVRIIILIIQNCIVYNSHYTIQPYQSLIIDVHVLNAQHSLILIALIYSYMRNSLLEIEVNKKCVIKHSLPQVIEREQAAWLVFNGKCLKLYLITAREQCVCAIHSELIHCNCNCNVPRPSKIKGSYNWKKKSITHIFSNYFIPNWYIANAYMHMCGVYYGQNNYH